MRNQLRLFNILSGRFAFGALLSLAAMSCLAGGGGTGSASLITAYTQFANKARARGLLAYGATITPFGGNSYYTTANEATRQAVNAWFRTNNVSGGVIDFDATVLDPANPTNLNPVYDSGDGLHLNGLGYQVMANSLNLNLFTK